MRSKNRSSRRNRTSQLLLGRRCGKSTPVRRRQETASPQRPMPPPTIPGVGWETRRPNGSPGATADGTKIAFEGGTSGITYEQSAGENSKDDECRSRLWCGFVKKLAVLNSSAALDCVPLKSHSQQVKNAREFCTGHAMSKMRNRRPNRWTLCRTCFRTASGTAINLKCLRSRKSSILGRDFPDELLA